MFKHAIAVAALMAAALSSGQALAETQTANFQVRIIIQKSCSVTAGAPSDIDLGTVLSTATNVDGTNNIFVTCSKNTPYYIGLAPSNGDVAGTGVLASSSGAGHGDTVPYQLYSDADRTVAWGNTATTTAQGNGVAGMGSGAQQTIPVYARAPSANFTPDSYADNVLVTVHY